MRVAGFILSFYLLFLAIEPGVVNLMHSGPDETACCSGKSCEPAEQKEPLQKCNDNNTCNPFLTCSNYTNFINDLDNIHFTATHFFSSQFIEQSEQIPPPVALEFWQPPKIA